MPPEFDNPGSTKTPQFYDVSQDLYFRRRKRCRSSWPTHLAIDSVPPIDVAPYDHRTPLPHGAFPPKPKASFALLCPWLFSCAPLWRYIEPIIPSIEQQIFLVNIFSTVRLISVHCSRFRPVCGFCECVIFLDTILEVRFQHRLSGKS